MEILNSLGVNYTLWIHLGCFLVSYAALTELVLKPYLAAMHEREKRTVGNEQAAGRTLEEVNALFQQYEARVRAVNTEMKAQYDASRQSANKKADEILTATRAEVGVMLETSRAQITTEVRATQQSLSNEIPSIGAAIASKLSGKEISA